MDDNRTNLRQTRTIKNYSDKTPFLEAGKLPPQAIDLEIAVLGAVMLEKEAIYVVSEILKPECFYKETHQMIYAAITSLQNMNTPIDILTVTHELKKRGELDVVGGPYFISQLTSRVASAANVEHHARVVLEKHIQRELIRISSNTIKKAFEDSADIFELLDYAEQELFTISEGNIKQEYQKMSNLLSQAIKEIEAAKASDGNHGVRSGFTDLDRLLGGWQKQNLIILAARPGMGKTAFILSMTRNIAVDMNIPVAIFSLEMGALELVNRLISSETQISSDKLRKGDLKDYEFQQLHARISKLSEAPIYIDDTAALSIFELRAKCRRLVLQHGVKIILIDYLQLMTAGNNDSSSGNRVNEISAISRSIKIIAKELMVPVIALSQLSRAVEQRGGDKKPQLSDLRESGAIEQDADIVSFIYRPEYYGITQDESGQDTTGLAQLIIAKNRHGAQETINLRFVPHLAKFTDYNAFSESVSTDNWSSGMAPNTSFEANSGGNTITKSSKMNDTENQDPLFLDNSEDDGAPF